MKRNDAIVRIRAALKKRSGKSWSVIGGTGTGWGWIRIISPPRRRNEYNHMTEAECTELAKLLGFEDDKKRLHYQGHSVPDSNEYRQEYVDRAEGRTPSVLGTIYWD